MLARKELPTKFQKWNARWQAPFGAECGAQLSLEEKLNPEYVRQVGLFGFQPNNSTREVEYPWAFFAGDLHPGLTAVEIGGALSGFQFLLARHRLKVTNVDPFVDYGADGSYPADAETIHAQLNRQFRTRVVLKRSTLLEAALPQESVDRAFCISTLEHLQPDEMTRTVSEVYRILRRGGSFIVTTDLFLNLCPFTRRDRCRWGQNVSIKKLIDESKMTLAYGDPSELFGFDEFDPDRILSNLECYFIGAEYPTLVQSFVLRK